MNNAMILQSALYSVILTKPSRVIPQRFVRFKPSVVSTALSPSYISTALAVPLRGAKATISSVILNPYRYHIQKQLTGPSH
jgi:hypothetical protein